MQDRQHKSEVFNLDYKILLMPKGVSIDPRTARQNTPKNTIALSLTSTGKVAAYLPINHHHDKTPEYIELSEEELSQFQFPDYYDSPKLYTEENSDLANKILQICGCQCNFLNYYDKNTKTLDLSNKNLTLDAIPALCDFLLAYPEIETLNISYNNIGHTGKELLAKNNTLKKIIMMCTNFDDEDAIVFSKNTSLESLNIRLNITTLKGMLILADSTIKKINIYDNVSNYKQQPEFMNIINNEENPLKRANYGRENGVNTPVPSLTRLCLYSIKETIRNENPDNNEIEISGMPDLTNKINQKRI